MGFAYVIINVNAEPPIAPQKANISLRLILNMDFELLREQKLRLISILEVIESGDTRLTDEDMNAIQGMINLLDGIQDSAVDENGLTEEEVFGIPVSEVLSMYSYTVFDEHGVIEKGSMEASDEHGVRTEVLKQFSNDVGVMNIRLQK